MPGRSRNKYGAKPTIVDGIRFHSKLEAARYRELRARVAAGVIRGLERQVPIKVYWPGHEGDRKWLLFTYVADFSYWVKGDGADMPIYEDVKGRVLNEFRVKAKGVKFAHDIDIIIVTRKRTKNAPWCFGSIVEEKRYDTE